MSKNRDLHSGSHRDRHRLHLNRLREKEQLEEERKFRKMDIMQPKHTFADASRIRADMSDLATRITVIEASLAKPERIIPRSRINVVSVVALVVSLATLVVVVWSKV